MQLETDNLPIQDVLMNFSGATSFKFLSNDIFSGIGYTAHKIFALIQTGLTSTTGVTKAYANKWKKVDVTKYVTDYSSGSTFLLTPAQMVSAVFRIPLNIYASYEDYDLSYLNYPSSGSTSNLSFGDETYFLGNVTTEIHADVYSTALSITLPMDEFNSSTNLTWDENSKIAITEIGIYDANKNLVAIGKLNDPIDKDSSIERTILFAIDF
jgi:hypothetical protein